MACAKPPVNVMEPPPRACWTPNPGSPHPGVPRADAATLSAVLRPQVTPAPAWSPPGACVIFCSSQVLPGRCKGQAPEKRTGETCRRGPAVSRVSGANPRGPSLTRERRSHRSPGRCCARAGRPTGARAGYPPPAGCIAHLGCDVVRGPGHT